MVPIISIKFFLVVILLLNGLTAFSAPEVHEETYFISELVRYRTTGKEDRLRLIKEEEKITLFDTHYQITGEYTIKNNGAECTEILGLVMYTFYSHSSVTPGIQFWVNDQKVPCEIIPAETEFDANGFVVTAINWAVIPVTISENCTSVIRFRYINHGQSPPIGYYIFVNPRNSSLKLNYLDGTPEFRVRIENKSLTNKLYESRWITNFQITQKDSAEKTDIFTHLMKEDGGLDTDLLSMNKTYYNSWTIDFKKKFIEEYERNLVLFLTRWDGLDAYCFMPISDAGGIGLGFLMRREITNHQNNYYKEVEVDISKRRLAPYELFFLTNRQLRLIRNIFYARHGYIFKDKELEKCFKYDSSAIFYTPNPEFRETMLTDIDKANIETIKQLEALLVK
jgi:hypothetical protein